MEFVSEPTDNATKNREQRATEKEQDGNEDKHEQNENHLDHFPFVW
jgi:hypothetical protein